MISSEMDCKFVGLGRNWRACGTRSSCPPVGDLQTSDRLRHVSRRYWRMKTLDACDSVCSATSLSVEWSGGGKEGKTGEEVVLLIARVQGTTLVERALIGCGHGGEKDAVAVTLTFPQARLPFYQAPI